MVKASKLKLTMDAYLHRLLFLRWLVLILMIGLVAGLASGGKALKFSNDYRVFFDPSDPELAALEELHNVFSDDDPLLFVITPKDGRVFSRETLASVEWLTREAWKIPYVQRVDSLQNYQYSRAGRDELTVSDLYRNGRELDDLQLATIQKFALSESQLLGRLVSKTGDVTGVFASFHLPGKDRQKEIPDIVRYAKHLQADLVKANPNLEVRLTGGIMMSNAFTEASEQDTATLGPLIFGLVVAVIWISLGSLLTTVAATLVIIATIVGTMGIAGWLGFVISPISAIAPNVLLTVAVADSIHVLVDFQHHFSALASAHPFETRKKLRFAAVIAAVEQTAWPIFLTTLTTAIGFLTLNFSDSPPFRDLGNIVAIGVSFAYFLTLILLPALLAILPISPKPLRTEQSEGKSFDKFAEWIIRKRSKLTIFLVVLMVGLGAVLPLNQLNDNIVEYFSGKTQFRKDWEYTINRLTGLYPFEYALRAKEPGGINDPEYLKTVEAFALWYASQPETLHVDSLVDVLKRLNKNMHGDDPAWDRLPDSRELASQYLLLYEMSLPPGLELNDRINIDQSATRFTATVKNLSGNEILDLEQRANEWLKHNAPAYMQAKATSPPLIFAHIGHDNIQGMIEGTVLEFVVISIILMFTLRSFTLGLVSLVPNVVPAIMAFGFWALVDGRINMGLSVVANMTLGIVVDDTVHFLSNYTHARRKLGQSPGTAVRYTFRNVGKAMAISTVVLAVGFGTLTLSEYALNAQMGLLTSITILFALLGDLFLLPTLLLSKKSKEEQSHESV